MDKQILNFTVNEQILTVDEPIRISTNKVNYTWAHFDLGTNWSGFDSVRAVWFNDFNCISTVLDSLGNCVVPFEVMKRKGNVKVNLVGSISEDDVLTDRLTSYPVVAVIVDCTAQITGANTSPITPSEYEQFVAAVHEDADRAETAATNAETSAQNASDSATSAHNSAESTHDDKVAIEQAIAEVIQQIEDFEQVQVVVNTLPPSSPATSDFTDGVLTLGIPQGVKGDTGNGIQSIAKVGTSGLVDTYRITFTDGQTTTFTVTNGAKGDTGNGIASIEKTSTVGLVDTYTITYTNGQTTTFTVTNGEKGDKGDTGEVSLSELEDATVVQTLSDNTPYNYRRTNNGNGSGRREYDEIVGASVAWNQLVANSGAVSVTVPSGHKYYSNIGGTKAIAISNGSAISATGGTDNIIDLTLFNSQIADYVYSLEQSTSGAGVTWLRTHFPKLFDNGYQPFDSGSIKSVSGLTAHVMCDANDNIIGNYPLDSSVALRGRYVLDNGRLKAVGDVYPSSGQIGRTWGEVDLGSLNWTYNGGNSFYVRFLSMKAFSEFITAKYVYIGRKTDAQIINADDKSIAVSANNGDYILVKDLAYSDAAAFKNAMSGVMLIYETNAIVTETATPYTSPQWCDSKGTEEYVGSELPVGHNTEYPMSLVDTMPTTNGTFEPRVTVTNGVRTVTWVSV